MKPNCGDRFCSPTFGRQAAKSPDGFAATHPRTKPRPSHPADDKTMTPATEGMNWFRLVCLTAVIVALVAFFGLRSHYGGS
jgi:hypothetical protein